MKKIILILSSLLVVLSFITCSDSSSDSKLSLAEKFQQVLDNGIRIYDGKGFSAAVIMPDGEIWTGAAGISHGTTPISTDMLFSAGSITKTFTAATILQLADEGILSLEDSLHKWLPGYQNIDSTITIRQLLNHTNGIFNLTEHPAIWQNVFEDPTRTFTMEEIVSAYTLEPYFPKGTDWHYSNTGYLLLRMIIKQATGSEIATQYRTRIFDPQHLNDSFLAPEEALPGEVAQAWFDLNGNDIYDELPFMTSFYSMAGGGVFCTAKDLALWAQALFYHKTVVSQQMYDQMVTFHSPCPDEPLVAGYGLGIARFSPDLFNNLEIWGHGGNALGYAAGSFYLPDYNVCIGVMDNTEEGDSMYIINGLLTIITEHLE